jgi:site-specific DNA recombinase
MRNAVALYCRLSPRPDGSYEGVDVQKQAGHTYATKVWPGAPVIVFADAGLSAARDDVVRPEYERLRAAIRDGEITHIWTVEQSRLERREIGWFELAAELDAAGITEVHTNRDGIVRVRDEVAGIKAVLAASEVRKMKKRVNDRLSANAANGQPQGGLTFGYVHARNEAGEKTYAPDPERAEALRLAADRWLAGWSQENIARAMRDAGIKGVHGGRITPSAVKSMLTNPSAAGFRVHQGAIVGRGNWEPILDEATWQACRARFTQPRQVQRADGGTYDVGAASLRNRPGRQYLLTGGLAVCGICESSLTGSMKQLHGGQYKAYLLCHPNRGGRGCVGILLKDTEDHVLDRLWTELDKPEFLEAVAADDSAERRDEITRQLSGETARRKELAAMWSAHELTTEEWQTAKAGIAEGEQKLRDELAALPPSGLAVDVEEAREGWDDLTLDERRAFVRMFIERVTIERATPGARKFNPGRVKIKWKKLRP